MLQGFVRIMLSPCKISTNYFALGGYSATFFNMGIVGLYCLALTFLPGCKPNNVTTLGVILTIGFGSWGMNIVNMTPTVLGVCLYAAVKKEKLGSVTNAMLYSTGIAPIISELLLPRHRVSGLQLVGLRSCDLCGSDYRLLPACRYGPCSQYPQGL